MTDVERYGYSGKRRRRCCEGWRRVSVEVEEDEWTKGVRVGKEEKKRKKKKEEKKKKKRNIEPCG